MKMNFSFKNFIFILYVSSLVLVVILPIGILASFLVEMGYYLNSERLTATVTEIKMEIVESDGGTRRVYRYFVEFSDAQGTPHESRLMHGYSRKLHDTGDQIAVRYFSGESSFVKEARAMALFTFSMCVTSAWLMSLVFLAVMRIVRRKVMTEEEFAAGFE